MNFLCKGFRKLASDRQTDRQTDRRAGRTTSLKLYTTPLRGWSIHRAPNAAEMALHGKSMKSYAIIYESMDVKASGAEIVARAAAATREVYTDHQRTHLIRCWSIKFRT